MTVCTKILSIAALAVMASCTPKAEGTGQMPGTVIDYINQLLLMEASYLLSQTSLSVAQIAEQLHFAETTTFARFFQRMKGVTPREFRKGK